MISSRPEQATAFRTNDLKVLEAGRSLQFDEAALHDDGPHTSIVSKFPLRRLDGTPYAICGITTDITERKIAEEALQASDAFTRAVLDSLSAHVCVLDKEGVILRRTTPGRSSPVSTRIVRFHYMRCRTELSGPLPPSNRRRQHSTGQAILNGIEVVLRGSQPSFSAEYLRIAGRRALVPDARDSVERGEGRLSFRIQISQSGSGWRGR